MMLLYTYASGAVSGNIVCAGINVNEHTMLSTSSNKIMFFDLYTVLLQGSICFKIEDEIYTKNKGLMKGLMQLKLSSQKYLKRLIVHLSYTNHLLVIKLAIQFHILPLVS